MKTPDNGDSSEQRLREIERLLEEKDSQLRARDRTVRELTERLSQTVERLDRVQRVGSDRTVINTAAFPKEVVEQQSALVEDLQRAVQLWESMQLSCGLERLETQLATLHELFDAHFREEEPEPEPTPSEDVTEAVEGETQPGDRDDSPPDEEQEPEQPLAEESDSSEEEEELEEEVVRPIRPPEILNLTEATHADLQRCVEQQDTYIDYLSARLQRTAEKQKAVNWAELASQPEKLKTQLEQTLTKIHESRHFAEFELALQRTRLKRKERELKTLSDELAIEMQSLDRNSAAVPGKEETPGSRRWMRMLGMGKPDSE